MSILLIFIGVAALLYLRPGVKEFVPPVSLEHLEPRDLILPDGTIVEGVTVKITPGDQVRLTHGRREFTGKVRRRVGKRIQVATPLNGKVVVLQRKVHEIRPV